MKVSQKQRSFQNNNVEREKVIGETEKGERQ